MTELTKVLETFIYFLSNIELVEFINKEVLDLGGKSFLKKVYLDKINYYININYIMEHK